MSNFVTFQHIKVAKTFLGTMLPPSSRIWLLIFPDTMYHHETNDLIPKLYSISKTPLCGSFLIYSPV
jgi:hypothetical protein